LSKLILLRPSMNSVYKNNQKEPNSLESNLCILFVLECILPLQKQN
jgi:hypothetical protein